MLTEKQLIERTTGIGSSSIAAVAGVDPYRTADDVFQEILGLTPPFSGNEATLWGDNLEPLIRKEAAKRIGFPVKKPSKMYRHPDHTFMISHLDGLVLKPQAYGVMECKNMRYPPKDVREHKHYVQLQWQLGCSGCLWGCLAILFGGNELKIFEFQRDEELIASLISIGKEFWTKVLNARKEQAA